jgi:CheY-like chemotaxis protein
MADTPPSTIQLANGNGGHQTHYQEPFTPAAPAPVRDDAPTRIVCFVEDLFFTAKIQETARKAGVKVEFIKGAAKEDLARLTDAPEEERPKLLVFDLNNVNAKPLTVIPKLKSKLKKATSIIGFLNHLQGELKAKAVEAGCDTVMPRSAFSQGLPNLLRRYGIDDDEDQYVQPV